MLVESFGPLIRRFMIEHRRLRSRLVAMQLSTDEGTFICNVDESDIPRMAAGQTGTFVVIHHAIRLDAMYEGHYELHETKVVETSSVDFYRSLQGDMGLTVRKGQRTAYAGKARNDG